MDSHVEVILQRSKNIDTTDWINVAKKPKKFIKPKKEKKEIVKKMKKIISQKNVIKPI